MIPGTTRSPNEVVPCGRTPQRHFPADLWFIVPALLACVVFGAIVTQGSGRFFVHEALGGFYDAQAVSLLHGQLNVPPESIQWEGFLHDGKWFGYFGPTPALLRLPFALLGLGTGKLTRLFLLMDFAAALLAGYLVLRDAAEYAGGGKTPRPSATILLLLNAGLGSTLLFLGSRAYVYHEAILCGVAFALWSLRETLRYLRSGERRPAIIALVCGVLSIQARAPTGLYALTCLLLAAGVRAWRQPRDRASLREGALIGVAAILGVLSFNAVSYLKFGTFEGCPLRMNLQYTPQRLAAIDGREFHAGNWRYGTAAYLGPHMQVHPYFPYVEMSAPDPRDYPEAKMDVTDGVLGIPFAMPGLTIAAGIGLLAIARRSDRSSRTPVAIVWLALIPLAAALAMAVAVAHRYTADFCPFLIAAAALGLNELQGGVRGRKPMLAILIATTAVAVPLTSAITIDFQGARAWGVPADVRQRYAELRLTLDHLLGVSDPNGYDPRRLSARLTDQRIVASVLLTLAADPTKTAQSISVCRALTEDFPAEPSPRLQLALLLCNAGRIEEGTAVLNELLLQCPGFAPAHYYVAILDARSGQLTNALRELEQAVQLDGGNSDYRAALAALRAAMGHQKPVTSP